MKSAKRIERGSSERSRRQLLELRKSIATVYWRERKASQEPFEEVENLFELANHGSASDLVISLSELDRERVFLIDEALRRIDMGTYGACTGCGGSIPAARLEAVPWTPFCVRCQQSLESEPLRAA